MSVRATVVIDLPVAATARQIQELLEYELGVYCSLSGDNALLSRPAADEAGKND